MNKLYAALAVLICLTQAVHAGEQVFPYNYHAAAKVSGTVTLGGTAQQVLAGNPNRLGFCVQNPSSNTESLFYDLGSNATISDPKSFEVTPGSGQCIGGAGGAWTGTVTVNAATTGHGFIVYEFN